MKSIIITVITVFSVFVLAACITGMAVTITEKNYEIGSTGPAGGIVFYDKRVFSDGWRYLEAAHAETEFSAQWGAFGEDMPNTMTAVGFGKRNTQIIVDRLKELGETNRAAQICAALDINGYKDWFLPSKDELDLMYKNLKQKELSSFKNKSAYWSSSQSQYSGEDDLAWNQFFIYGHQGRSNKDAAWTVRAVRAF